MTICGLEAGWGIRALHPVRNAAHCPQPMQKFLRLEFIASSPDAGLLLLRLWLGLSMLWLHGWSKLMNLFAGKMEFLDPLGIGQTPSFILTVLAEVGCSALLVIGLWTRWAAVILAFTMGVAFFVVNGGDFAKAELGWLYLGGYLVLFAAGAGKFSVDKK
jgi:putative oxidoreductase